MRGSDRHGLPVLGFLCTLAVGGATALVAEAAQRTPENVEAAPSSDALVFVGSGRLGSWETQFAVSNGGSSELGVLLGVSMDFPGGCPVTGCPGYQVMNLAPNASGETATPGVGSLDAIYVRSAEGDALPLVSARTVNSAPAGQAADVPGFRLSTLLTMDLAVLAFPGARAGASRSNLVLTNLLSFEPTPIRGGEIEVRIEAFDPSGALLGSTTQQISVGATVLIQNVYATLGGSSVGIGQIRATRVAGDRAFWGVLYTFDENGAVSAAVPQNP